MKMHVITVFGQKDLMKLDSKEFNTSITILFNNIFPPIRISFLYKYRVPSQMLGSFFVCTSHFNHFNPFSHQSGSRSCINIGSHLRCSDSLFVKLIFSHQSGSRSSIKIGAHPRCSQILCLYHTYSQSNLCLARVHR